MPNGSDDHSYEQKLAQLEEAHEALCRRCGECCGVDGSDPCSHLIPAGDGFYTCDTYADRLGIQKTRSGVLFTCVTIRDVHKHGVFYNGCAYNKDRQ